MVEKLNFRQRTDGVCPNCNNSWWLIDDKCNRCGVGMKICPWCKDEYVETQGVKGFCTKSCKRKHEENEKKKNGKKLK